MSVTINEDLKNQLLEISQVFESDIPTIFNEINEANIGTEFSEEKIVKLYNCLSAKFDKLIQTEDNYLDNCYKAFKLFDFTQSLPDNLKIGKDRIKRLIEDENLIVAGYLLYRDPDKVLQVLDLKIVKQIQRNLIGEKGSFDKESRSTNIVIRPLDYIQIYDKVGEQLESLEALSNSDLYVVNFHGQLDELLNLLLYWKGRKDLSREEYIRRKSIISFWAGGFYQTFEILRHQCSPGRHFSAQEAWYYIKSLVHLCTIGRNNALENHIMPDLQDLIRSATLLQKAKQLDEINKVNGRIFKPEDIFQQELITETIGNKTTPNFRDYTKKLEDFKESFKKHCYNPCYAYLKKEKNRILETLSTKIVTDEEKYYYALIQLSEAWGGRNGEETLQLLSSCSSFQPAKAFYGALKIKLNDIDVKNESIEKFLGPSVIREEESADAYYDTILQVIHRKEILFVLGIPDESSLWSIVSLSKKELQRIHEVIREDAIAKVFSRIDKERSDASLKSYETISKRRHRINLGFRHNEKYSDRFNHIIENIKGSKASLEYLNIHANAVEDGLAVSIGNYELREVQPYIFYIYYYYLNGEIDTRTAYTLCLYLLKIYVTDVNSQIVERQAKIIWNNMPNIYGIKGLTSVIVSLLSPLTDINDTVSIILGVKNHLYIPPRGDQLKQYEEFKVAINSTTIEKNGELFSLSDLKVSDFLCKIRQLDDFLDSCEGKTIPDLTIIEFIPKTKPHGNSKKKTIILFSVIIILFLCTILAILGRIGVFSVSFI